MTKLLVVEDDGMNRDLLAKRLAWEGYQIVTAADGVQAVVLAQSETPDLILMDMGLPVLSGWQAASRIKASAATRHIPIIALTAYALAEERDKSISMGCDDFESKPIDFARLLAKMAALLSGAAPDADQLA
jgi:CheY-like chemotaxis protein